MLDPTLRPLIDPPLQRLAHRLRWHADAVTLGGFVLGLAAALVLALDHGLIALGLFLLNRLADGLDGALARLNGPTDRGGLLDIVLDFSVYALLAFAFAWRDPASAALPAAFLLAAFMATASSFLAYAIIAAKRGQVTEKRGRKSFYHLGGLTEGTETILFFALCLALPGWFPVLAWIFGAMAWLTAVGRVLSGWRDFA
ncbi:MAG: CDP-alcohol phosphatidyltransferase family protein [Ferrovibrio sp.]|uniref:CDP-alcohol phosphatidyltransferase family protein n=1 Tax=Ferrovibrio sp. TaxID=1917215 RepID=UPI003919223B